MFQLPSLERGLFAGMLLLSVVSAALGGVQIARGDIRLRRLLTASVALMVSLTAAVLALRGLAIGAFPMTGVFESMLIVLLFIGLTFLLLSVVMPQVWFSSVMAWVLWMLMLLAAAVAKPAAPLHEAAQTPWVIVHALSMSLAGAMIVFAAANSILFLWSRKRLKSRHFPALFGRMPTLETLERLTLLGLRLSLAALTAGLVSGVGLVGVKSAGLGMTVGDWLTDSKIVMIAAAWCVLLGTLLLRRWLAFGGKAVARMTLVICFLILFAFIGSTVFCKSGHDFNRQPSTSDPSGSAL